MTKFSAIFFLMSSDMGILLLFARNIVKMLMKFWNFKLHYLPDDLLTVSIFIQKSRFLVKLPISSKQNSFLTFPKKLFHCAVVTKSKTTPKGRNNILWSGKQFVCVLYTNILVRCVLIFLYITFKGRCFLKCIVSFYFFVFTIE